MTVAIPLGQKMFNASERTENGPRLRNLDGIKNAFPLMFPGNYS